MKRKRGLMGIKIKLTAEYVCGGCGKEATATGTKSYPVPRPRGWKHQRGDVYRRAGKLLCGSCDKAVTEAISAALAKRKKGAKKKK